MTSDQTFFDREIDNASCPTLETKTLRKKFDLSKKLTDLLKHTKDESKGYLFHLAPIVEKKKYDLIMHALGIQTLKQEGVLKTLPSSHFLKFSLRRETHAKYSTLFRKHLKNDPLLDKIEAFMTKLERKSCTLLPYDLVLSEILYLLEHSPKSLLPALKKDSVEETFEAIDAIFGQELNLLYQQASSKDELEAQKKLTIALGHLLISSEGVFNHVLIPRILQSFMQEKSLNGAFFVHLQKSLTHLYQSTEAQEKLAKVRYLPQNNPCVNDLIKSTLNLPYDTHLDHIHAKKCVLTAFLSHLRQGKTGSCFATFMAIELQNIHPEKTLEDLIDLVETGMLVKKIKGIPKPFPYLLSLLNEDLHHPFLVEKSGKIESVNASKKLSYKYLWEEPKIISTCQLMGIKNYKEKILEVIKLHLFKRENDTLTLEQVFKKMTSSDKEFEMMKLYYSSRTTTPLLRVWENSLAGLAEGETDSILKKALFVSLKDLLVKIAKKEELPLDETSLAASLENLLDNEIHYLYDPSMIHPNFEKKQGAFILYEGTANPFSWKRIDDPSIFEALMFKIFLKIFEETPQQKRFQEILFEKLSDGTFMADLLNKYYQDNDKEDALNGHFQKMKYLPWVTFIGNDPKKVMKVYEERSQPVESLTFEYKNGRDLLQMIESLKDGLLSEKLILLRVSGYHSFSLLLNHPSLMKDFPTQVSHTPSLSSSAQKKITTFALKNFVSRKLKYEILKKWEPETGDLPLTTFQKKFKDFLKTFHVQLTPEQNLILDCEMVQHLPEQFKKEWSQSFIHFADSNWQSKGQDIHYALGVNPLSGQTEIISVLEDGTLFELHDQKLFNNHMWEIAI